jgi:DNA-directed RNA polymerase specialized sigma24 family protein
MTINPRTSEALVLIDKHRAEFLKTIKALYGNNYSAKNYAEDYMQEVYLKLSRYDTLYDKVIKPDGTVSKGYVFFAMKSIVLNDLKRKKVIHMRYDGDMVDVEQRVAIKAHYDGTGMEVITDNGRDVTDQNRDEVEEEMYRIAEERLEWFDFKLFKTYLSEGKSYRILAAETGLGIQTIYLSINKTKLIIAEELFDMYSKIK